MAIAKQTNVYEEFAEFITGAPTLEEIIVYRLSDETEARISALLELNRAESLAPEEETELDEYIRLEHLMRMVKIRAYKKLDAE